jgi:tripartite-type tricarboxylate transporter receptor subunit TctC
MKIFTLQAIRGLIVAAALSLTATVNADTYPSRDITYIISFAAGGSSNPVSQVYAEQMEKLLGGNINLINRPGGSGTVGTSVIVKAKPDGYTIGLASNSSLAYFPLFNDTLGYKTPDDYEPIVKLFDQPVILAVRADSPWKTFEEFMSDVKKNPGKVRASVSGVGSVNDLAIKQLNKVAGVKISTVPFSGGGGEAMVALLGGRVEAVAGYGATALGHAQAGKIRVLAAFMKGKYDLFPEAVSIPDAGYNATLPVMFCVIAPKGLPKDVRDKLVSASQKVVRSEEYRKFAKANGYLVDPKGPEELKAEINEYNKTFADLMKFIEQK